MSSKRSDTQKKGERSEKGSIIAYKVSNQEVALMKKLNCYDKGSSEWTEGSRSSQDMGALRSA